MLSLKAHRVRFGRVLYGIEIDTGMARDGLDLILISTHPPIDTNRAVHEAMGSKDGRACGVGVQYGSIQAHSILLRTGEPGLTHCFGTLATRTTIVRWL